MYIYLTIHVISDTKRMGGVSELTGAWYFDDELILPYCHVYLQLSHEEYQERLKVTQTLYVGNMSFYTMEEQVYELFSMCGEVKRVIMGLDRMKKTPCGFCFVEYPSNKHLGWDSGFYLWWGEGWGGNQDIEALQPHPITTPHSCCWVFGTHHNCALFSCFYYGLFPVHVLCIIMCEIHIIAD